MASKYVSKITVKDKNGNIVTPKTAESEAKKGNTGSYYNVATGQTIYYNPTIKETYFVNNESDRQRVVQELNLTPIGSIQTQQKVMEAQAEVRQNIRNMSAYEELQKRGFTEKQLKEYTPETIMKIQEAQNQVSQEISIKQQMAQQGYYETGSDLSKQQLSKTQFGVVSGIQQKTSVFGRNEANTQPKTFMTLMPQTEPFTYSPVFQPTVAYNVPTSEPVFTSSDLSRSDFKNTYGASREWKEWKTLTESDFEPIEGKPLTTLGKDLIGVAKIPARTIGTGIEYSGNDIQDKSLKMYQQNQKYNQGSYLFTEKWAGTLSAIGTELKQKPLLYTIALPAAGMAFLLVLGFLIL